jgi:cytochrome b561
MGLKNTADRYGAMIVSIHWVSAQLIIILLVSGFGAANTVDPGAKAAILKFHLPLAIPVLALTILRLGR